MSTAVDPALRGYIGIAVRRGDAEAERIARQNLTEAKVAKAIKDGIAADASLSADARARRASTTRLSGCCADLAEPP